MSKMKYLVLLSVLALHFLPALTKKCPTNITAVYAFGDGFLDTGNNDNALSICYAKHKPYGVSFPDHFPTGRFSDAEVPTDIISGILGLSPLLPAYSKPGVTAQDLLTGVSFASGCSGMDPYTSLTTNVLSLPTQFTHFQMAVERMKREVGKVAVAKVVQGALYLISGGTHDFLNNFYPLPSRSDFSVSTYIAMLHANLVAHIKMIHDMGGMKIMVLGMPPVGCLPFDRTTNGGFKRECVESHNKDAQAYNNKLQALLETLQTTLPGTRMVYVDIYSPLMDIISNPAKYGMVVTSKGCCGTGLMEIGTGCSLLGLSCNTPSKYVFWDAIHPSQATFRAITNQVQDKALRSLLC